MKTGQNKWVTLLGKKGANKKKERIIEKENIETSGIIIMAMPMTYKTKGYEKRKKKSEKWQSVTKSQKEKKNRRWKWIFSFQSNGNIFLSIWIRFDWNFVYQNKDNANFLFIFFSPSYAGNIDLGHILWYLNLNTDWCVGR